ncbi:MAG: ATP-binding cassette domain-containing protein [Sphingobacteriales bacterium]|nr:MAG: ATP-binding cassette domain-containing protein [Sphingobacteriales bacterium]
MAGGCVRDGLLGRPANDLDLATDATPDTIEKLFPKTVPVGKAFGVMLVIEDGISFEVKKGEITIDGIDIHDFQLDYLRSNIATVLQDVFLFSDTILNNITLNNPEIKIEEVVNAAKKVGAHDFIERLPGGYQYNVMERGSTLSAGQAQLISFIRALVHNPAILVLDEATSSVDTETELLIQKAIDNLMEGRTSIVIAHRLSTIQKANQIIVLDKGEIKEKGTHQQLLKLNGYYKRLYDLQFSSEGIAKA